MKKGSLKSQMKKIIECKTLIDLEKREPLKSETMKAPSAQNIEKSLKNEENSARADGGPRYPSAHA